MNISWWEIKILCDPKLEDTVFWRLQECGFSGTATEVKDEFLLICAYLPQSQITPLDLAAIAQWLKEDALRLGLATPVTAWELIPERDWQDAWKKHWQPQPVGDRLLIYPAWLEPPTESERKILRLNPGIAFGTGEHPTTQLCLASLEMHFYDTPSQEQIIADIGCGSGILSIAALLLGATKVYAVDTDPLAVNSAIHNRELNRISPAQMLITQGSVPELAEKMTSPVDGIVCNILAEVIIELIPQITQLAKPTTWAVFSGLILDQIQPVVDVLEEYNWSLTTIWKREQWCCLNLRR
ncbi:50S ribosomal protein L11 methyltransferase [Gloeocapsa sp. PCC 73106]|uniref:50S ribosomal protein L11 methyltransferase n=1 Tax=Gloeocapsa sp. PCC 73106 TaxID=102232 RepID=UPI0002ACEDED|nr:50S ribosomal protein L11 methyltransferase [Gloeocapsa sp. PCC 73106]ELR97186.1 ribosomal protein L11 methyltransferase [Gloeocapsa sp. PCC 73106]